MEPVSLSSLSPGERGIVRRISLEHKDLRRRLLEMGIISGKLVEFVRTAPMGDPIEVRIGEYRLSLRRDEADAILVQREPS